MDVLIHRDKNYKSRKIITEIDFGEYVLREFTSPDNIKYLNTIEKQQQSATQTAAAVRQFASAVKYEFIGVDFIERDTVREVVRLNKRYLAWRNINPGPQKPPSTFEYSYSDGRPVTEEIQLKKPGGATTPNEDLNKWFNKATRLTTLRDDPRGELGYKNKRDNLGNTHVESSTGGDNFSNIYNGLHEQQYNSLNIDTMAKQYPSLIDKHGPGPRRIPTNTKTPNTGMISRENTSGREKPIHEQFLFDKEPRIDMSKYKSAFPSLARGNDYYDNYNKNYLGGSGTRCGGPGMDDCDFENREPKIDVYDYDELNINYNVETEYNDPGFRALNSGNISRGVAGFGREDPESMRKMLNTNHNRRRLGYTKSGIRKGEIALTRRNYDRDDETLGGFEYSSQLRGYDMNELYARNDYVNG